MGTNTDPYQRCEGKFRLTRQVDRGAGRVRQPVLDPDQVDARPAGPRPDRRGRPAGRRSASTSRSAPSTRTSGASPSRARPTPGGGCGPSSSSWRRRRRAACSWRPVLPGLSDAPEQLAEVADACKAIGVRPGGPVPLHLRPGVKEHVLAWVRRAPARPGRAVRALLPHQLPAPRPSASSWPPASATPWATTPRRRPRSATSTAAGASPPPEPPKVAPTRQLDLGL